VAEIVILFVVVPCACLFAAGIVFAVGVQAVLIYVGALLAAWMFSAFALPMLFGALSPSEIVEGYQSRRRHVSSYEGEPLRGTRGGFPFSKWRFDRYRSPRRREKFYPLEPPQGPRAGFPFWKGRVSFD
jgi:hypothetical protein